MRRSLLTLFVTVITIAAPFIGAPPAFALGRLDVNVPNFPTSATVGSTGVRTFTIENTSTPPDNGPVLLNTISLTACTTQSFPCVADPNPVLLIAPVPNSGTGACAGINFTASTVGGQTVFTPSAPVLLGAPDATPGGGADFCSFQFTYVVQRVPAIDAVPAQPGVQTGIVAFASGNTTTTGVIAGGFGGSVLTVIPATPAIVTAVSPAPGPGGGTPTVNVGSSFTDTATVTGVANGPTPTGTVSFAVIYDAPGVANCTGVLTQLGAVALNGPAPVPPTPPTATATSPAVTATSPGTYHFVATYSGDANYAPLATTACGAPGENVLAQAPPAITTVATSSNPLAPPGTAVIPDTITDTATVTGVAGAPAPSGTVTFTRYVDAPGAAPCSGPATLIGPVALTPTNPATVPPSSTASTPPFAPTGPGTVRFVATYNGDAFFTPVTSPCGAAGENVTVQAVPVLSTLAASSNPAAPAGTATTADTVADTATVTGTLNGPTPTGTVTFVRYFDGPGVAPCAGPSTPIGPVPLTPANPATNPPTATASTPAFAPPGPGTVRFVASYSGDANYTALPPSACGAPGENVTVVAPASIVTVAASTTPGDPPGVASPGAAIADTATVTGAAGGPVPTGTVTFTRFQDAIGAAPCSGAATVIGPVALAPANPATNPPTATAATPAAVPPGPGTVRFVATYSGDAFYSTVSSPCGAAGENVTVQAAPTLVTLAASSNPADPAGTAGPGATVSDTATVTGVAGGPAPTGTVTFTRFFDPQGAAPCSSAPTILAPVALTPVNPAPNPPTSTATTPAFAPPTTGTVRFVARYSGDAVYAPLPNSACGAPGENVAVLGMPGLSTLAASSNPADAAGTATPGATVADTATVTGVAGGPVPTGTVTFTRYFDAPGAAPCSGVGTPIGPLALTPANPATNPPSATVTTPGFAPPGPGTVRFVARYSGDAVYAPAPTSACGAAGENVTVLASPFVVTLAASSNAADPPGTAGPGASVADTATITGVAGLPAPTGTVTFTRFFDAPGAAPCSGPAAVLAPVALTPVNPATNPPSARATSAGFVPPGPGTVRFVASYSGDAVYAPLPNTACGAVGENVTVAGNPTLVTSAASSNPADPAGVARPGAAVADTATVTGIAGAGAPTGTITFTRYLDAPGAAPCSGAATILPAVPLTPVAPATVPPTSTATSAAFTPAGPGTVRFQASYSGDTFYGAIPNTACGAPGENVTVLASPFLVTLASSSNPAAAPGTATIGESVADTATVTGVVGASAPTGTVTFTRFVDAPGAAPCSGPATVLAPIALTPVTPATSPPSSTATAPGFPTTGPGTVRFVASYSGDATYTSLPTTPCGAVGENVTVNRANPLLSTVASAGTVGSSVFDTATLSGGVSPTGTILFQLYNNQTCTGAPVFTSTRPVTGNGDIVSDQFVLPAAGIYHFVATYSGDANNSPVGPTSCLDANETVGAGVLAVGLSTVASGPVIVGQTITDTATLTGGFNPTGTITFRLYGPANDTCAGAAVFSSDKTVNGNGAYTSDPFTATQPGTYHWVAAYSGDANNASAVTACADPLEQVTVTPVPTITIDKTATPLSLPAPGGAFNFHLVVTNTSNVPLTILTLTDDVYHDVTTIPGSTCNTAIGTVLAPAPGPGNTYSCNFQGVFNGVAGASQTDTAMVTARDARGNVVRATDDAIVTLTPQPLIRVDKTAIPLSLPVPGGDFVFHVVVTNTGPEALTITSLLDDKYGNIAALPLGTCNTAIGKVLAPSPGPGNTYTCDFVGRFTGPAGATQTDVVTVVGTDSRGVTATAHDDATVTITPLPPSITTTKTASPPTRPEPGGTFTFNYSVTNTGPVALTVVSIVDDVYGNLNGRGTCATGAVLAANGGTYSCSFTGNFFGDAGASQTDTITTTARDAAGNQVISKAQATVLLTDVPPAIQIVKSADPTSRPAPGGTFRFTVKVTNPSFEPITITSLVDDIYGDLNGRGSCAVGVVLAANGGSYSCAFDGDFRGQAGASQTDTVTVIAVDNEGTKVTASAQATVTLTPVGTTPTTPTPIIVQTPQTLVRTGSDLGGPVRLAGILLLVGLTLVGVSRYFGDAGGGLAPAGGGGPGPGPVGPGPGGGTWFGDGHWFGGARTHPPRPPRGGAGAGLLEPTPAEPEPEAPAPADDAGWDGLVVTRAPLRPPADAAAPAATTAEPPAEVVVATVVGVRVTGALDGAALDAAQSLSRPAAPAAGAGPAPRWARRR